MLVSYDPDEYLFDEACLFRSYVPVDRLDELEVFCIIELLFCPDYVETVLTGRCRISLSSKSTECLKQG
jgi:hypothetical protein